MKELIGLLVLIAAFAVIPLVAAPNDPAPSLPVDDPMMRDLIECWQGPGEKKLWRSLTDGQVEITDGGVILFSNRNQLGEVRERALINMECRVTYDIADPLD